jgi:hypothetical protein
MKRLLSVAVFGLLTWLSVAQSASAAENYQSGRITNVTFVATGVLIMLDSGLPTNCTGTPFGWMMIPSEAKPISAFVLGLWLRGDAASEPVTVYTTGRVGGGYCQVDQIDPDN